MEKEFVKYKERGSLHWREMSSRDLRVFNASQQARYDWMVKILGGELKDKKILDLGCGDGGLSFNLAKAGARVTGIDNEPLGVRMAEENLATTDQRDLCVFKVADAYALPFEDASFDHVVNSEVIEHVEFPERLIAEAKRVLKPGGKFIVTTPYRLTEFPKDPNHLREYYPTELEKLLRVSFPNVEIRLAHHVFWFGLFTYTFRWSKGRQFGRWFINLMTLWFGYNPFMIEYPRPAKFDRFALIQAICSK